MASVKPFAAVRPRPDLASRICELPYDVLSSEEARHLAKGNNDSFFHISKPEIDLPIGTDPYSPEVYNAGRRAFLRLLSSGCLSQDPEPSYYLYRQKMGGHVQTGFVGVASCQEYLEGIVRRHEFTRVEKEDDRVRHIETVQAQTGPAFLLYPHDPALEAIIQTYVATKPAIAFVASDGVEHAGWCITESPDIGSIEAAFARMPRLYIADGHHRTAAAGRIFQSRQGAGGSSHFLSVLFSHQSVQILPYHRVVKDLNGDDAETFLRRLGKVFDVSSDVDLAASSKHSVFSYLEGRWYRLRFKPQFTEGLSGVEALDATLLQRHVFDPLLRIDNPRTSKRIDFVGGIRGTPELERLVNRGEYACAFAMHPTDVRDLMEIADAGGIMPPKSTWFEPKLRDGMFSYLLSGKE